MTRRSRATAPAEPAQVPVDPEEEQIAGAHVHVEQVGRWRWQIDCRPADPWREITGMAPFVDPGGPWIRWGEQRALAHADRMLTRYRKRLRVAWARQRDARTIT